MIFKNIHPSNYSKVSIALILGGFITIGAAFFFFFSLAEDVAENEQFMIDKLATRLISSIDTPALSGIMGKITEAGSVTWITIGTVLTLIYLLFISDKSKWVSFFLLVNMLGISGLTKGLKLLFERQRPDVLEKFDGTGFSFPSGHSTGAITFYGFLFYLIVISNLKRRWKITINTILGVLTVTVALSRIFIGVHYLTDILAGLTLGLAWLLICIMALELMLWRQRRHRKARQKSSSEFTA
ncbi:phosphatase PAP2 family protein [Alkalihalobacillus sp. CinArs1]|uniref:phosphatase PAP2 family protein n=1 Tax=Alkalihalobacillus sp. CinArs1 TaxID=2995314 RepID=UPI0022DD7702|nr:phosphatase PAP2 family protein [Alkalihalobacillus sp. CinArs1]